MFLKKDKGGLGVRKPSLNYTAARISFLVNMLNHLNENIRFVARNSLELDMKKRGAVRSRTENNFLGYAVKENGLLDTNIKGEFGVKSNWPHSNHLAQKVDAKFSGSSPKKRNLMSTGNAKSSSLLIQLQKLSSEKQLEKKSWKVNSLQIPTN